MAKPRVRRVGQSTSRRRNERDGSPVNENQGGSANSPAKNRGRNLPSFTILFFVICPVISVIAYRRIYSPDTLVHSRKSYLFQHHLIKTDLNYRQVLTSNLKVDEDSIETGRHFQNPVLAYITPWNSKGYYLSKKFSTKFTHLSPVWYELRSEGTNLVLDGRHNVDKEWISDIRNNGDALILPRVVLEAIPMNLLKKKKERDKAIKIIIAECKEMEYDGIVLESWSRWAAYGVLHDPDIRNMGLQFIRQLGEAMHSVSLERRNKAKTLELVYVIGPPHSDKLQDHDFGPNDLQSLGNTVDGFSLMTYDFSGPQNPGPNAPLNWMHSTLQLLLSGRRGEHQSLAKKIFLGINFYGNDFVISGGLGGGPIIGHEYVSLLEKHKPALQWEETSGEHFLLYTDEQHARHVVFYPSFMSLAKRLEAALFWDVGISIWEIGQGLDSFFHML